MFIEPPCIVTYSEYTALSNFDEVLPSLMQGYFKGVRLRVSGYSSRYRGEGFQGSSFEILYWRLMVLYEYYLYALLR